VTAPRTIDGPALAAELTLALDLASRGGALALRYQREGIDALGVTDKPDDGGPVTRADIEVDAMICGALRRAFPGDAVLAEESYATDPRSGDGRRHAARCWMIDPVDGTRGFSRGDATWAVHIGLCIEGEPTLGVVHEPAAGRTSFGLALPGDRGGGAWVREPTGETRSIQVIPVDVDALRLVTSQSHRTPIADEIAAHLRVDADRDLRLGSTGVKIVRVARGVADVYVHPSRGTKLWDTCAPQAILHAAGGRLTDLQGERLAFLDEDIGHREGLLASPANFHPELVAELASFATRL